MEDLEKKFKGQLFICTNQKPAGECCGAKGAEKIQKAIKEWIKSDPNLRDILKVTKSGCLSHCEEGITAVLYPDQEWMVKITQADTEELKKKLLACVNK